MKAPGCNRPLHVLPIDHRGGGGEAGGIARPVDNRGRCGRFHRFVVRRTGFGQPPAGFSVKKIMREAAVTDAAGRYRVSIRICERTVPSKT